MNIENASAICFDEFARQHPHVSGQTNQIDLPSLQSRHDFAIVFCTRTAATLDYESFNSKFFGFVETRCVWLVTDYDRDLGVGDPSITRGLCQRGHIRSASGDQDSNPSALNSVRLC